MISRGHFSGKRGLIHPVRRVKMKAGSRGKAVVEKAAKMRPKNNPILRTRIYFFFSLVLLFVLMVFSSSCSINPMSELHGQNTADITSQPTTKNTQNTPSISYEEVSITADLVLSATPTILPTSSYRYVDPT